MKKILNALSLGALLVGLLAGCASGVRLEDIPVEERSGAGQLVGSDRLNARNAGDKPGPVGVDNIIYFDYDSFAIKPEYQSMLEAHARFVRADRNRRLNIEGHTDERGGREYNLGLGQKRAEAVRRSLTTMGVADSQIEAVSYGKEKPAAQGADESAFAKNRRTELTYR
jgi:peptidoglycan-associated lipoprotein